jgi:hypothetical protein
MAKTYVLDRVAADLARGFTHPAIQRLSSLVAAYPNDLDLRRRLAAVHRRVGNRIQAGRWDYLTIGADSRDTRAFERAFPSAVTRLRAVRWPHRAGHAATTYARNRLAKLVAAAAAERPAPATGAVTNQSAAAGSGPPTARRSLPGNQPRAVYASHPARPGPAAARAAARRLAARRVAARKVAARLVQVLSRWRTLRQSPSFAGILVAVAVLVAAPLVLVGLITVVQWIVQ